MSGLNPNSLSIPKTFKLFIGGEFPRTESGRSFAVLNSKDKTVYANVCRASRKDFRNAITSSQAAQPGWQSKSAYNRGQILYRMAEMTESKRAEFVDVLTHTLGVTSVAANKQIDGMIDAFVYYAGFSDKYQQLMGAVNPVSGPHHNFTSTEPVGVVAFLFGSETDLATITARVSAAIVSGNAATALLPKPLSAIVAPLSEVFATSDLPGGVVNLLTGDETELASHMGSHMEVDVLCLDKLSADLLKQLKELGVDNMKRIVEPKKDLLSLESIVAFVEYKTVWHPIGN